MNLPLICARTAFCFLDKFIIRSLGIRISKKYLFRFLFCDSSAFISQYHKVAGLFRCIDYCV